jgi:XTP/dITP diphosphohydrolase
VELLVGTTNAGKLAEIRALLRVLPIEFLSLTSLGNWPEIVEDGKTFEENALKKARTLAEFSGYVTVADDSGLEVDALNGEPGIRSARYSGEEADDAQNNEKLLRFLEGVAPERRGAQFVCVLALCAPRSMGGKEWLIRQECRGIIAPAPKGADGFGYDPLFFYPPFNKTFGEIDRETKATVSHRGKALRKLIEIAPTLLPVKTKP